MQKFYYIPLADDWFIKIRKFYSIFLGHSLIIALNRTKLETIAKTIIAKITTRFPWMKFSIPLNARRNEIRLFKKWANIGTKMFLDLI